MAIFLGKNYLGQKDEIPAPLGRNEQLESLLALVEKQNAGD